MSKTDIQLKDDVEKELHWDPRVNAAHIGVSVTKGAVSLVGAVETYAEKWAAEDATKRVNGVRAISLDLDVKLRADHVRTDSEIAVAILNALKWDVLVPKVVTAEVEQGTVTLQGRVTWNYERDAAERAIRYLTGVTHIFNTITLQPEAPATQVKDKVEAALRRQATADAQSIHVETSGSKVTLTGHASSWRSMEEAANAAWAAPGVTQVVDHVKLSMTD